MARKVMNRMALREEAEAAEARGSEATPVKKKATKKKATRSRAKTAKTVRMKAFWGVYNQSLKRVQLFEYSEHDEAVKKAEALSASTKQPHFVQPVKEAIED